MLTGGILLVLGGVILIIGTYLKFQGNKEMKRASTTYLEDQAEKKQKTGAAILVIGVLTLFFGSIPFLP